MTLIAERATILAESVEAEADSVHARFAQDAIRRLQLASRSFVVHLGSQDGAVLRQFSLRGTRVLGIEPAADLAQRATVPTAIEYFCDRSVRQLRDAYGRADLIIIADALERVRDLDDFVASIPL